MNNVDELKFLYYQGKIPPVCMVFLYSKQVKISLDIIQELPADVKSYFRFICIDNKSIKDIIENSQNVKVNQLPSIFVMYRVDKEVVVDEVNLQELLHNLNIYVNEKKALFNVIDESAINEQVHPEVFPPQQMNTMGKKMASDQPRALAYQRKMRASQYQAQPSFEEYSGRGITTYVEKPIRGQGHAGMAQSSINYEANSESDEEHRPMKNMKSQEERKADIDNARMLAIKEREQLLGQEEVQLPPQMGMQEEFENSRSEPVGRPLGVFGKFGNSEMIMDLDMDDFKN